MAGHPEGVKNRGSEQPAPHKGGNLMKSKLGLTLLALLGLMLLPAIGLANANQESQDKDQKVRKITGCLSKGESANEYELTADNGSTWEVKSDAVNLSPHVGQTVTVTGTVNNAAAHGAKEKAKEKTMHNPNEHGHLTATNVKTVSESCTNK
jgi:hypothetical protein